MILESPDRKYSAYRIPGMIRTDTGAVICYYECRKGSHRDWASIDLKIIRSEDDGESFSTVQIIDGGEDTLNNPVMIFDLGKIHFLFCKNYSELYYSASEDDGRSFFEPRRIEEPFIDCKFPFTVYAVGPGHGISHRGRLIVPIWFANNPEDKHAHRPSFISTIYSDDSGETWHLGERIDRGELLNPSECALASSGEKVIISIRCENEERCRAISVSESGIGGWSKPYFERKLEDPVCEGSMDSFKNQIFHINCASSSERENLTVKATGDLFQSFSETPIDEIGGYSDISISESEIFVIYERGRVADGHGDLCFKKLYR